MHRTPDVNHLGWTLPDWEEFDERVAILLADNVCSEEEAKQRAHEMVEKGKK